MTGDTHGSQRAGLLSVDGFMHRLNAASFPAQREMTKKDYVVILGDFGGVWEAGRLTCGETRHEKNGLDWLESRPFTTLFVPGNHENYDRLTGCRNERLLNSWYYARMPGEEKDALRRGYPRAEWRGGFVRVLRPSVLMLERGEIFDIDGCACLALGGAQSHDMEDGILDPADYPDEAAFKRALREKRGLFRVRGVSWWEEEMPSPLELRRAESALKARGSVDFVFTHDGPARDKRALGWTAADPLSAFLDTLAEGLSCRGWYYGHLHENRQMAANRWVLYDQTARIR